MLPVVREDKLWNLLKVQPRYGFFITSLPPAPKQLLNMNFIFCNYTIASQAEFVTGHVYKPYVHFFSLNLLVEILKNNINWLQSL